MLYSNREIMHKFIPACTVIQEGHSIPLAESKAKGELKLSSVQISLWDENHLNQLHLLSHSSQQKYLGQHIKTSKRTAVEENQLHSFQPLKNYPEPWSRQSQTCLAQAGLLTPEPAFRGGGAVLFIRQPLAGLRTSLHRLS